jgi:hypothetical protein
MSRKQATFNVALAVPVTFFIQTVRRARLQMLNTSRALVHVAKLLLRALQRIS